MNITAATLLETIDEIRHRTDETSPRWLTLQTIADMFDLLLVNEQKREKRERDQKQFAKSQSDVNVVHWTKPIVKRLMKNGGYKEIAEAHNQLIELALWELTKPR